MLNRPARSARPTPRPAKSSVDVCARVSARPCDEPAAPERSAPYDAMGLMCESNMTIDDATIASSSAMAIPEPRLSISRMKADAAHEPAERIVDCVFRSELAGDRAAGHDDDAVGQRADLVEVVRDEED